MLGVGVFGSTLAANITLGTNDTFQFGQGVVQATACDAAITVAPGSSFTNAVGAGSFKFGTVTLSGVDKTACDGKTFTIKAYDNTAGSSPLAIFATSATAAYFTWDGVGTDSASYSNAVAAVTGTTVVETADGTGATITFTVPQALASTIYKVTLETS